MSKQETSNSSRAAIVLRRQDGRWEVQVSESEGGGGARRWHHRGMFSTEQEAECFARSILPYCETAWRGRSTMKDASTEHELPVLRTPDKTRRPLHKPEG